MILHKCHEYFELSDEIARLFADVEEIKPDEEPDEAEFGATAAIAKKAHNLLLSLKGVNPTVLDHIEDLGKHFSEISSGLDGSYIMGHLETIRQMVESELKARNFSIFQNHRIDTSRKTSFLGKMSIKPFLMPAKTSPPQEPLSPWNFIRQASSTLCGLLNTD